MPTLGWDKEVGMQEFPGGLAVKASASLLLWLQYCCGSGSIPGLGTSTRHRHSSPHSPKRRRSRHAVLTLSFCHPFPLPVSWAGCQPPGHMGAMYERTREESSSSWVSAWPHWAVSPVRCPTQKHVHFGLCYASEILDLSVKHEAPP